MTDTTRTFDSLKSVLSRLYQACIEMSNDAPEIRIETVAESRGLEMLEAVRGRN